MAAPFSAIIMVGAAVLPEVMVGITDASITRNPAIPRKRKRPSNTAIGSLSGPILTVPTGWKMVEATAPAPIARSSSLTRWAPGRYSCGWNGAKAGWLTTCRMTRKASAAT